MPSRARQPTESATATAEQLHAAAIHLLRALRQEDRAAGLSGPRLSALSVIVFAGPVSMSALAAAEQVQPPTITKLVQDLERDGLVERATDPDDKRVQRVRATAAGRTLLLTGKRRRVLRLARGLQALSQRDQRLLERAAQLIDALARGT